MQDNKILIFTKDAICFSHGLGVLSPKWSRKVHALLPGKIAQKARKRIEIWALLFL
jgi:hypothetical protein